MTDVVVEPELLVAVSVYFLVVAGDIHCVPAGGTAPMPWSMETEVAPPTCHCNVAESPGMMLVGYIEKRKIRGRLVGSTTVAVVEAVTEPRLLVAVKL